MDEKIKQKFDLYPDDARIKLMQVRRAVFEVTDKDSVGEITETLKWGELSYLAKGGSTVRMDWKPKFSKQVCVYFHCQTKLVDTFREIYREVLSFESNRAIVLPLLEELKHCISMSLRYHSVKHLPLLGN